MLSEEKLAEIEECLGEATDAEVSLLCKTIRELQAERQTLAGRVAVMREVLEWLHDNGQFVSRTRVFLVEQSTIERYVSDAIAAAEGAQILLHHPRCGCGYCTGVAEAVDSYRASRAAVKGGK